MNNTTTYPSGEGLSTYGEIGQRAAFRYKSAVRSFCEAHGIAPGDIRSQRHPLYEELEMGMRRAFHFHSHDYLRQVLEKMRSHEVG